jgi:hypothetical protein
MSSGAALTSSLPSIPDDDDGVGSREGARVAAVVASDPDLEFFVTDVGCGDDLAAVERASAVFAAAMPDTGVVMLSAGARRLVVHARVPAPRANVAGCAYRLIAEALVEVPHVVEDGATDLSASAVVWKDESTGRDPFADKDTARSAAAEYLHESGLFGNESESEEEYEVQRGAAYEKLLSSLHKAEGDRVGSNGGDEEGGSESSGDGGSESVADDVDGDGGSVPDGYKIARGT